MINKQKIRQISLVKIGEIIENFWFSKFHWIYFLIYIPFLAVLVYLIWNDSIKQTDWSVERKRQYVLESGNVGRDFQLETFEKIIQDVERSENIFKETPKEMRNVFLQLD